jgi:hypothetical protein
VLVIVAGLGFLAGGAFRQMQMHRAQALGVHNCQQIIFALKQFANDHQGRYPDSEVDPQSGRIPQTANEDFRQLIELRIVKDEHIFGCPNGFNPDGNLGSPPSFNEALQTAENHWAMTAGQTESSAQDMPLVFENPRIYDWPPQWNADIHGEGVGRTWPKARIIIGRNDGSVTVEKLSGKKGMVSPTQDSRGMDCFTRASLGVPQRVLPVIPTLINPLLGT